MNCRMSRIRGRLVSMYGDSERIDPAYALRAVAERDRIHPRDVAAFLYRDWPAANIYAESNRRYFGHDVIGPFPLDDGVATIVDFRPALTAMQAPLTDPSLPDDAAPRR